MASSIFPQAAKVRTFPLSEADMADLAAGNPVEILAGVPGVVHVPVSGLFSVTPGVVPYGSGAVQNFVGFSVGGTTLVDFGNMDYSTAGQKIGASPYPTVLDQGDRSGLGVSLYCDGTFTTQGAILTSSLDSPGSLNVVGDVLLVENDGDPVVSATPATKTFTFYTTLPASATYLQVVTGANAGLYTIVSGAGTDTIVVAEDIPTSDTGAASWGSALLEVDSVTNSAAIVGVNAGTSTITLQGDVTGDYTPGDVLLVYRNTGVGLENTFDSVIVSVTLNGGNTDIVVVGDVSALTADGYAGNDSTGFSGGVSTYTVTDAGQSYTTGVSNCYGQYGNTFDLDITSVSNESSATGALTLLYYDVTV